MIINLYTEIHFYEKLIITIKSCLSFSLVQFREILPAFIHQHLKPFMKPTNDSLQAFTIVISYPLKLAGSFDCLLIGIFKIQLAVGLLKTVDARIDIRHLNEGIVDLGGGLELADVHQLHQKGLLVFGEFLMLASSRPLLSQLDKDRPRCILDTLDEGLSEDLLGLPLLDSCGYECSELEVVNSVPKMMLEVLQKRLDEGLDLRREMLKKEFILSEVSLEEDFAGEQEECGLGPCILMPKEVFLDELGDLQLAVSVVGDAVLCHAADLFLLELQVLQRILKMIEIHVLFYYIQIIDLKASFVQRNGDQQQPTIISTLEKDHHGNISIN